MQTVKYFDEQGQLDSSFPLKVPTEVIIKGYEAMLKTRLVEERMVILQRQGAITFAMTSLGEEACAVGSAAALEMGDWMYPQYREAGILFYRGFSIQDFVHQMFGDAHDLISGRQMPNHFGDRKLNIVQVSSPIGTKIPHAAGAAYAMKYRGEQQVAICYFGEGATSEGDFHVGLNFGACLKVPCIFFCRNNGYAISTPVCKQFACSGVAVKGEAYGIQSLRVDGNDFFAVYWACREAKKICLEGKGPVLIEAMTYRLGSHSTSDDPTRYREEKETIAWKEKDPLLRLRRYLEREGLYKDVTGDIQKEIDQAIVTAKGDPKPSLHTLFKDVYAKIPPKLETQYQELKTFFPEKS